MILTLAQLEIWEFDSLCQDAQLLVETREPRVGMGGGIAQVVRDIYLDFLEQGFDISCWQPMVERGKACAT